MNEIGNRLLPINIATPLALISYELIRNSVDHAFEPDSPVSYIQILLEQDAQERQLTMTVKDSGRGLPQPLAISEGDCTGLPIVHMIIDHLGGHLELNTNDGTSVAVTVPAPEGLLLPISGLQKFEP